MNGGKKKYVFPLQTMKALGYVDAGVHIFTAAALGRGRVASPMLSQLYPRYSFYRTLSGPQHQPGYEGMKKNLHPSDTLAVQSVAA